MRQAKIREAVFTRGHGPYGSGSLGATRVYQSFMASMEVEAPDWQLDAECSRHPTETFIFEGQASRPALVKAASICNSCVAKDRCLEEASPGDLYWTVRAGLLPRALIGASAPDSEDAEIKVKTGLCGRGHKDKFSWNKSKGCWYCRECERLRVEARRNGEKLPPITERSPICKYGHDKRVVGYRSNGGCMECNRISDRDRKAMRRSARIQE